jgi:acetyltransferase-like isoleucine patch superfamily enzyme
MRRTRALLLATGRDQIPPPPSAFKSYGESSWIVPPARVINADMISIGNNTAIMDYSFLCVTPEVEGITPSLTIGDRCRISRFTLIACVGEITIGDDVMSADRVFIGDANHNYEDVTRPHNQQGMSDPRPIHIGNSAFSGIGATILHGVTIGEGAVIGAGAVVSKDVPPFCLAVGNPVRVVRRYDQSTGEWVNVRD